MPQYLSPGVYVEEVPSAVQPIAGVGTSTAGFIAIVPPTIQLPAEREVRQEPPAEGQPAQPVPYLRLQAATLPPAGEARLITGWRQFTREFADLLGDRTATGLTVRRQADFDAAPLAAWRRLAHAVYGFFNNGGSRCYVARVDNAAGLAAALTQFAAIDEIALVAIPGLTAQADQGAVLDHCEGLQDRFAVLDGQQAAAPFTKARIQAVRDSNYGAIYFPWIRVFDPSEKIVNPDGDGGVVVPPSGHVAGMYARVDTERGVHKAPANEVLRGALDVEQRLARADQDGLNPGGVNVIRAFDGNIKVWGARTMGGDANGEWKYINVRRLFLFLRESIDQGTQWVVFEPNDPGLWARITRNVTAFLTNVWRDGALFGDTPAEAFYVKCDAETNPPEVRDLGQVITEIGVAVVRPAEFVIFRISQWAGPGNA